MIMQLEKDLVAGRAYITPRNHWCQFRLTKGSSPENLKVCSIGAIMLVVCGYNNLRVLGVYKSVHKSVRIRAAVVALSAEMCVRGVHSVSDFNDWQQEQEGVDDHARVLAAWDRAIAKCRATRGVQDLLTRINLDKTAIHHENA